MTNLAGTNVASAVRPFTDQDKYAVAFANEIKGGRHSTSTIASRNIIPFGRREPGMHCFVEEDGKTYELINNHEDDITIDSDWKEFSSGGFASKVSFSDGETLQDKFDSNNIKDDNIVFIINSINLGPHKTEFLLPYNGKVKNISCNLKSSSVVTKDLVIDLECLKSGVWTLVGAITIPIGFVSASALVDPSFDVEMEFLRLNIISGQENLSNLVTVVTVQR